MAEGKIHEGEQIVELAATEDLTRERMAVDSVLFEGSAAGTFVFQFGNVSFSVYTASPLLGRQVVFNRNTNYVKLVSGPAGATAYVFLARKK